jgi:glucokinase
MVFFSLGTGIGGGLVIEGRLRLGPLGAAGEIGHQTVRPDGPLCGCGNHGCLETVASGTAIAAEGIRLMRMGMAPQLHESVDGDVSRVTARTMAAVADQDPAVRDALLRAASDIGIAAANVVTAIHPELVVLGGGVADIGALLVDTVKDQIRRRVGMFPADDIEVKQSKLAGNAGLMGALALARMSAAH